MTTITNIGDAIRRKAGRSIPADYQPPRHAQFLRTPGAFVEQITAHLNDDGMSGVALPWPKTAGLFRIRPHEMTAWAGSNGSGKSTTLSEIMLAFSHAGQRVVILSLEMPAYKVAAKMAQQAHANRLPSRERVVKWADSLEESLSLLDVTGDMEPADCIRLVNYCAHELRTQHILIDNLTKIVSADNEHAEAQRRFVAQLHRIAIDTGMHVHLVAHTRKPSGDEETPPGRYEVAGSRTLVDQPDNVVTVWRNRPKELKQAEGETGLADQPDLILNVAKQRHGDFSGHIKLWMDRSCYRLVEDYAQRAAPMVK